MALILVVDDKPEFGVLIRRLLEPLGYEVQSAPDGAAALERVKVTPPDLILLDLNMPVMTGWEFARAYAGLPGPHAPIVVIGAVNPDEGAATIGAAGWLAKPFKIRELLATVKQHVATKVVGSGRG